MKAMEWYNFFEVFFAGAFIANAVPHFVHGISGDQFPTPFSSPRGVGLSSSTVNVLWSMVNMIMGYCLVNASAIKGKQWLLLTGFLGFILMSLLLSIRFRSKQKE